VATCLLVGCWGCATNEPSSVDLEVNSTLAEPANATQTDVYVVAKVANYDSAEPLETGQVDFALETTEGPVEPSTLTSTQPCDPTMIGERGVANCVLAFEIPATATPTSFVYDDHMGDAGSTPMPAITVQQTTCTQVQGWADGSDAACTECITNAEQTSCYEQLDTYMESCGCYFPCANDNDVCGCEAQCDTTACQEQFASVNQCVVDQCSTMCP
jgi:hypothetical protein